MAPRSRNPRQPREDTPGDGWIAFARIGRPHGLKGGFFLLTEDRRTAWDGYRVLRLEVEEGFAPCAVMKHYLTGGALALQIDLLASREDVEAFQDARLFVHRNEIPVADDETLVEDLTGLTVIDEQGRTLGTVSGVVSFGAQDNLRIAVPGRVEDVLFPWIESFVLGVEKERGIVRVRYEPTFFEEA